MKCVCGKEANKKALLPTNVYAGLMPIKEWKPVCDYHADKAKAKGYGVI